MTNNKYGAKGFYWNAITKSEISKETAKRAKQNQAKLAKFVYYFDSQFEFRVWLKLKNLFDEQVIHRQYPFVLTNPCKSCPNGKIWKVDFAIIFPKYKVPRYLIEAKGFVSQDFQANLLLMEALHPVSFKKLLIVFERQIPANRCIKSLAKHQQAICSSDLATTLHNKH